MQLLAKQGETQLWTGVGLHEHGGSSLLNDGLLGQICRLFGELIVSNSAAGISLVGRSVSLVTNRALKAILYCV